MRKTRARKVEIEGGDRKSVQILVSMGNPAGVFQIEQVLEKKLGPPVYRIWVEVIALEKGIEIRRTERS